MIVVEICFILLDVLLLVVLFRGHEQSNFDLSSTHLFVEWNKKIMIIFTKIN
jgi:hypothetical protein